MATLCNAHTGLTHAANADVSINVEELIAEQDSWLEREMLIVDQLNDRIDQIQTSRPKSPTPDPREGSSTESLIDNQLTGNKDRNPLRSGIKLSKLELATFDGINVDMFSDFKEDHYTNIYCNKDLSGAVKKSYLRRTCKGEAYRMIPGFSLTQESYETAYKLLCHVLPPPHV